MEFKIWKNTESEGSITAPDIDAAVDVYVEANGDAPCDCISDHITLLIYKDGVVAIAEDGYAPDPTDFGVL
jgi:hypothetical protein